MPTSRATRTPRSTLPRGPAPKTITLARNLSRVREWRGYEVGELAALCALPRQALRDIEGARRAPTIEELWALSGALGVSYARLLRGDFEQDVQRPLRLASADDGVTAHSKLLRRSGVGKGLTELYQLKIAPHGSYVAEPRAHGSVANIVVTRGRALVEVDGTRHDVALGDGRTVRADVRRVYQNAADGETELYVMVSASDAEAR